MRQLATFPSAETAQSLTDYLLTLHIETKLEQQSDGWAIWVRDEDQLAQARQELEQFNRDPSDPRYTVASRAASSLRREKRNVELAYHRRQERFASRMGALGGAGRWTTGMIIVSALVSLVSGGGQSDSPVVQALSIAPYRFVFVMNDDARPPFDEDNRIGDWQVRSEGMAPILHGEVWRVVTPIFLHFTILHLLFNMSWLYTLGGAIERRRGPLRYLSLVLVLAIISNLSQYFFGNAVWEGVIPHPVPQPSFGGMSGVVYGLFGYVWMKARFHPELGLTIHPNNIIIMMVWFFLCMTPWIHFVLESGVANVAHAAGLIAGILIGYLPILWHSFGSE